MSRYRQWMYQRLDPDLYVSEEFRNGVKDFIHFAIHEPGCMDGSKIRCPCNGRGCRNRNYLEPDVVEYHLLIKGKTKDNNKSREDLRNICSRPELDMDENGAYPPAKYILHKQAVKALCDWVRGLKFPDGYVSNLGRGVEMQKYQMSGMKSHDCHVFMQRLLPIAFRELLPESVWVALTEFSLFFKDLTCTTIRVEDMMRLEKEIPIILCKLEQIFPPSFFDSMEHLPVHLPYEARIAGPVHYRWMYPFERYLKHLKKTVGNKARVEGSIGNAYLTEEASNFGSLYFEPHVHTRHRKVGRNDDGGERTTIPGNLSIFTYPGRASDDDRDDDDGNELDF